MVEISYRTSNRIYISNNNKSIETSTISTGLGIPKLQNIADGVTAAAPTSNSAISNTQKGSCNRRLCNNRGKRNNRGCFKPRANAGYRNRRKASNITSASTCRNGDATITFGSDVVIIIKRVYGCSIWNRKAKSHICST